jgi:hypothetical protein
MVVGLCVIVGESGGGVLGHGGVGVRNAHWFFGNKVGVVGYLVRRGEISVAVVNTSTRSFLTRIPRLAPGGFRVYAFVRLFLRRWRRRTSAPRKMPPKRP